MIVKFIDEHKHLWGIEPICRILSQEFGVKIAPQTYCASIKLPPSARSMADTQISEEILKIHKHPRTRVYGIRKIHATLNRAEH